jgi:comEA protein
MQTYFSLHLDRLRRIATSIFRPWVIACAIVVIVLAAACFGAWYQRDGIRTYVRTWLGVVDATIPMAMQSSADTVSMQHTPAEQVRMSPDLVTRIDTLQQQYERDQQVYRDLLQELLATKQRVATYEASLQAQTKTLQELAVQTNAALQVAGVSASLTMSPTSTSTTATQKIKLNTATAAQLETLPGVGPTLAARIIAYRTEKGNFTSLQQLSDVSGIGDAVLQKILPNLEL